MLRQRIIRYKGKKITVLFAVDRCTHVAECLMGLPEVFDTRRRPWVSPDAATPDEVAGIIERCPTGALHHVRIDGGPAEKTPDRNRITVEENGPLNASGNLVLRAEDGAELLRDTRIAFCRCGASKHRPFCDNRHDVAGFEDRGRMMLPEKRDPPQALAGEPLEITLVKNGPLKLSGPVEIAGSNEVVGFRGSKAVLCRCGATKTAPFCDGRHTETGFIAE